MTIGIAIGLIGLATLIAAVFDAVYMMRLRHRIGDKPALRQAVEIAFGAADADDETRRAVRLALLARILSFAGIVVLALLLMKL
jgi:hypothetical protein